MLNPSLINQYMNEINQINTKTHLTKIIRGTCLEQLYKQSNDEYTYFYQLQHVSHHFCISKDIYY